MLKNHLHKLAWFAVYWFMGVIVVFTVAMIIRSVLV
jgi:hypothetical protein